MHKSFIYLAIAIKPPTTSSPAARMKQIKINVMDIMIAPLKLVGVRVINTLVSIVVQLNILVGIPVGTTILLPLLVLSLIKILILIIRLLI